MVRPLFGIHMADMVWKLLTQGHEREKRARPVHRQEDLHHACQHRVR